MAKIDLRTPEARREFGLVDETILIPSHAAKSVGTHRSRAEALNLIVDVLKSSPRPMSRLQIARAIGRAKSPYFVSLLMALVEAGDVVETAIGRPNGAIEYQYTWGG